MSNGGGLVIANNTKLKELDIGGNQFDKSLIEDAFSNILCNETRANNVFISNHTLEVLYLGEGTQCPSSQRLISLLQMNKGTNKRYVAIKKIAPPLNLLIDRLLYIVCLLMVYCCR